jgi:hypothetical protein
MSPIYYYFRLIVLGRFIRGRRFFLSGIHFRIHFRIFFKISVHSPPLWS